MIKKGLVPLFILLLSLSFSQTINKEKLVILSPHWEGIRKEFGDAFKAEYRMKYKTDIDIEWMDQGGTSDILRYIKSEFAKHPGGINVDLLFGGGVEPYLDLSNKNLLEPYKLSKEELQVIPEDFIGSPLYDSKYRWYGTALSGFGILRNERIISRLQLPNVNTWSELTSYRLRGWVGSADPRHSGAVHMMYEIILQAYGWDRGWDIITKMGANIKSFTQAATTTPTDVKNGEIAYGLSIDVYAWSQIAEIGKDKMKFVLPSGTTVISPDGLAILKGAPNQRASKEFLEFVMSKQAQKLWMLPKGVVEGPKQFTLFRMSILPNLYTELGDKSGIPVNPFKLSSVLKYDNDKGSQRYGLLNDLIGAMIIDSHDELVNAWDKLNDKNNPKPIPALFSKAPLTETEASEFAKSKWSDPTFRNQKLAEWISYARGKYNVVGK